ncbi:hypothetical protein QWY90_07880 [Flavobacterium paronense]|uniref:Uncharacterized protein n=1 Tax=Flavobacterium paronense TaxID=1392775 RepID=A0ABV5GGU9_9FLAO|nr:hypothetical protein [Flavobacterium paronense]MDN3677231.1 hypothetical protein [Flavobacterium paronense]
MDSQAELNWIHQEIDKVNDPTFLEKLKTLLKSRQKPSTETIEEYNSDIESALDNIAKGNFVAEEEARSISKKWNRK